MTNQDFEREELERTEADARSSTSFPAEARSWLSLDASYDPAEARRDVANTPAFLDGQAFSRSLANLPTPAVVRPATTARAARATEEPGSLRRGVILAISIAALAFLLPVLLAVGLAVWAHDGGPVFFAHRRVGRGGRTFYCLKFRSMALDAEQRLAALLASDDAAAEEWRADHKLRNDPRVTSVGGFLRKTSLDELPQLFNVLRGEMSLVGPRPIVEAEIAKYGRRFRDYCAATPGITGLWQVSGRNDTTYRRRVALDALYARHQSTAIDLWILARTIPAVLARRGSY